MAQSVNAVFDDDGDWTSDEESEVHVARYFQPGGRRTKMVVEIPPPWEEGGEELKELMMDLDHSETHREWDPAAEGWTVDLSELNRLVRHFTEAGREVSVDLDVVRTFEDYSRGGQFMPERR